MLEHRLPSGSPAVNCFTCSDIVESSAWRTIRTGVSQLTPVRTFRVLAELTTTFASHYSETISLREVLQPEVIARYAKRATGEKFLIDPSK
jgi:hypothetical protein